jgi:hypothetical protein
VVLSLDDASGSGLEGVSIAVGSGSNGAGTHAFAGDVNCNLLAIDPQVSSRRRIANRDLAGTGGCRGRVFLRSTSSPRSFSIVADVWVDGGVVLKVAAVVGRRWEFWRGC